MNALVKKLEEKLLPDFEKFAAKIREEIPNISVRVYSGSSGSQTEFQGHDFWVDCIFQDIFDRNKSDNIALGVELCHLTTIPRISAGVCWGHPSGHSEADFPDYWIGSPNDWLVVTDEVLEDLYKDLPRLYDALFEALKRRKPADE